MLIAYEEATLAKYRETRGDDDAHLFPALMDNPQFRCIVQIAFEAGRDWQSKHPSARIDVPDYDPKEFKETLRELIEEAERRARMNFDDDADWVSTAHHLKSAYHTCLGP